MSSRANYFSSRWGLMLAMLGMAVGTGNIWRFPRIAAANGGGSFLVAWVVFLLVWSIPLIMLEFALGNATRKGPLGVARQFLGARFAWAGAWIAWTAAAIGFYYAVVMGWTLRYALSAIAGRLDGSQSQQLWDSFAYSPMALVFHALAVLLAVLVVSGGVAGIERLTKILIPLLLLLVVVLTVKAVTLDGASTGLHFLFTPHWGDLANYRIWLEALTQNAWDTGAGWGLVLCYAIYSRKDEDTNLNAVGLAVGNNCISLMAGVMVLCTVFSFTDNGQAVASLSSQNNEGLTFIWIPQLFQQMPGGGFFQALFFIALVFAAWTSLLSLFEVLARVFAELGFDRRKVMPFLGLGVWLLGVPSAISQRVFANQDFVWSVALMISGLIFALMALRYGVTRFRHEFVNRGNQDLRIGAWWDWAIRLVVVEALVLVVWWFWQVRNSPLFAADGLGLLLVEWAAVALVFVLINGWMVRRMSAVADRNE